MNDNHEHERTNTGEFACAPVLLIGFNRPDYMAAQIAVLRLAKPVKLYVAVDGPRDERPDEMEQCRQVRECVSRIDWPCELKTLFRDKNLGCKLGVSGAITWFFKNESEGMVLEDDCRPTLDFLRFATEMLEKYRDDERIGAICGFNFFNLQSDSAVSYHFSAHMDVWGWASWRRVWKDYDVDVSKDRDVMFAMIESAKATAYYKKFYKGLLCAVESGLSTWDVQFSLLFLKKGYLSAVPKERLVANVGLEDGRATHTGGYVYWAQEWTKVGALTIPLIHPNVVLCDETSDRKRERMEGAIIPRGLTWLGVKFPWMCGFLSFVGNAIRRIAPWSFEI